MYFIMCASLLGVNVGRVASSRANAMNWINCWAIHFAIQYVDAWLFSLSLLPTFASFPWKMFMYGCEEARLLQL